MPVWACVFVCELGMCVRVHASVCGGAAVGQAIGPGVRELVCYVYIFFILSGLNREIKLSTVPLFMSTKSRVLLLKKNINFLLKEII